MSADLEMAYVKHKHSLLAIALNVTHCQSLAEDAIQIAFSRLVQNNFQADDLDAYVFKTVRNAAIDLVRKRHREQAKVESFFAQKNDYGFDSESAGTAHVEQVIRDEELKRIRETIDSLSPEDREIILLKIYSGFTFEQVADITHSNNSTIATRYRRLLEKLLQALIRQR